MMEHEQINDRSVALSVRCTKLTARTLAKALQALYRKMKKPHIKHGKQSLKSLTKDGASIADVPISGDNIGTFKKTARKYNIDFALKRDDSVSPPNWIVFFKAKDDRALQSAFKEFTAITLKKTNNKGSMLEKLNKAKELVKSIPEKVLEIIKNKSFSR